MTVEEVFDPVIDTVRYFQLVVYGITALSMSFELPYKVVTIARISL